MTISPVDLRRVKVLAELDDRELARLAGDLTEREFSPGTPLISEGAGGIGFFMILEGHVRVLVGDAVRAGLGPGDHVGELALLNGDPPRNASVIADDAVRCAIMTAWQFRPFVREHPTVAWRLLEALAARLREANAAGSPA